MADNTKIEWTEATWTPIRARNRATGKVGWHCEHVTPGCEHCYAETMNRRLGTGLPFKPGHRKDIELFLDETMLTAPLRWRKPRMIFVCSMTDLFADFVPDDWIDRMFAVMALAPQHTFQLLSKRPERMRAYMTTVAVAARVGSAVATIPNTGPLPMEFQMGWPVPNVWLGTSVEDQTRADERIPVLLDTPAAIRFVSCEPLLGPIDMSDIGVPSVHHHPDNDLSTPAARAAIGSIVRAATKRLGGICLDWVIVGGESGPDARPFDLAWARSILAQCNIAGVACFVKQLGSKPLGHWGDQLRHAEGFDLRLTNKKGGDWSEWPADLRVRQFPHAA